MKKKVPKLYYQKDIRVGKKISIFKGMVWQKKKKTKDSHKDIYFVNDIERHWNKGFQNVNCILHIIIIFTAQNRDSLIQYTYTCTNISHEWYYAD